LKLKWVIKFSRLYHSMRVNAVIVRIEPMEIQFVVWQLIILVTKQLVVRSD
jgi:hypothetical protein